MNFEIHNLQTWRIKLMIFFFLSNNFLLHIPQIIYWGYQVILQLEKDKKKIRQPSLFKNLKSLVCFKMTALLHLLIQYSGVEVVEETKSDVGVGVETFAVLQPPLPVSFSVVDFETRL